MNPFFDIRQAEDPPPPEGRRYYARIASVEPEAGVDTERPRTVSFEVINADQFEKHVDQKSNDINTNAFAMLMESGEVSILECRQDAGFPYEVVQNTNESAWFMIEVDEQSDVEIPILQYMNLFSEPVTRSLSIIKQVRRRSGSITLALDRMVSTNSIPDADPRVIVREFTGDTVFAVAAYDVGQGNWQGLLNYHGIPIAYFDIGGGVLGHLNTFPDSLNKACFSRNPPIVLSHWDWDHWSSAQRFTDALSLPWIVPRQPLGPIHRVFLYNIMLNGSVYFWPKGLSNLRIGQIEIRKCTGKGRNHSGLAVSVSSPSNRIYDDILLTGDCDYSHIPNSTATYRHLVVPHHGARMPTAGTPVPVDPKRGCAVISRGEPNRWEHPRAITFDRHISNNWTRFPDLGHAPRLDDSGDHHLLLWDEEFALLTKLSDSWPSESPCSRCPNGPCDFEFFTA